MYYLGVDLGGTNIACAVVTHEGEILGKSSIPTALPDTPEAIAARIVECCRLAVDATGCTLSDIASVGIGTPGIANADTGIVEYSCNLGFQNTPLGEMVSSAMGKPVYLENDANAAALGEYAAGSGRGSHSLVAITLGTGVGGGVVLGGRLLTGFNFAGAEIGHFVIKEGGEPCGCGRRGCFEAYSSASALIRQTKRAMEQHPESTMWKLNPELSGVNGRTAFDAMRQGDETAAQVVRDYVRYLACGLTSIINIFQPEILCVGGGICNEGETLLAPVREIVDREDYARDCKKRTSIVRATLGNDAGIIGAALLPLYR
jgi:glucokinase